jgi:5-amino-6-(5-phosphoribosylamino)uracil reductase
MPRPYVLLSVAQSLDGYIDDRSPERLVLSSSEDLDRVDQVRAGCDALMVGAVTLRRDNPRLRVKSPERRAARKARGLPEELLRVFVTRSGKLSRDLRVWTASGQKIIYSPDAAADGLRDTLGDLATVVGLGEEVDLGALLDDLGSRGIGRLMVEGGEQLHTQFLAADLADELHVTIGGFFVADPAAPRFVTPGVRLPQSADRRMQLAEVSRAGETAVLRYLVRASALSSSSSRVPTRAMPHQVPDPEPAGHRLRSGASKPGRRPTRVLASWPPRPSGVTRGPDPGLRPHAGCRPSSPAHGPDSPASTRGARLPRRTL